MKDQGAIFFPQWTMFVYMPAHIYFTFQLAIEAYAPRSIGYAIFPILIFGFVSSIIIYLLINIGLYYRFGKRNIYQVFEGNKPKTDFNENEPPPFMPHEPQPKGSFFKRLATLLYRSKK